MKDINGGELREGGMAMLLCEVLGIEDDGVHVRVMNSTHEILVGCKYDEVLGGIVADSELTAFEEPKAPTPENGCKSPYHRPGSIYCLDCIPPEAPLGVLLLSNREPTEAEIERGAELANNPCPTPSK